MSNTALSTTCQVNVSTTSESSPLMKTPRITLKSLSGKKIKITSSKVPGAKEYHVYRATKVNYQGNTIGAEELGFLNKNRSFIDKNLKTGKRYYYYVAACKKKHKSEHITDVSSETKSIRAGEIRLRVSKIKQNSFLLRWNKTEGITKYRLYRKAVSAKKYKKSTIKKSNRKRLQKRLKAGTQYNCHIVAYYGKKKVKSDVISVKTKQKVRRNANTSYINNNLKDKGIVCSSSAKSKSEMNAHYVENSSQRVYPSVKYNVTGNTVYIHVYINMHYASGASTNFQKYSNLSQGVEPVGRTGTSYKTLFKKGITSMYNMNTTRNRNGPYDFGKNVAFNSRLIVHEKDGGGETFNQRQEFINVQIGGTCTAARNCEGNGWFHAHTYSEMSWFGGSGIPYILMPTNQQLAHNAFMVQGKNPTSTEKDYSETAAHEMGHALGLGDAYEEFVDKKPIVRISGGVETGKRIDAIKKYDEWQNLMTGYPGEKVRPNDIEMMLNAYVIAVNDYMNGTGKIAKQYYKKHTYDNSANIRSNQIRNGTKRPWKYNLG